MSRHSHRPLLAASIPTRALRVGDAGMLPAVLLFAIASLLGPVNRVAAAPTPCPKTLMFVYTADVNVADSTAASNGSLSGHAGACSGSLSFDAAAGLAVVTSSGNVRAIAQVEGRDQFEVGGLPTGTVVSFTVRLHVSGTVSAQCGPGGCAVASLSARLWDVPSNMLLFAVSTPSSSADGALDLPLSRVVGEPFTLFTSTTAYAYSASPVFRGTSNGQTTLDFVGLPSGAYVFSCKGFLTAPVATAGSSWGRVKVHYR